MNPVVLLLKVHRDETYVVQYANPGEITGVHFRRADRCKNVYPFLFCVFRLINNA